MVVYPLAYVVALDAERCAVAAAAAVAVDVAVVAVIAAAGVAVAGVVDLELESAVVVEDVAVGGAETGAVVAAA